MFFRKRNLDQQTLQADRLAPKHPGWFLFFKESFSGLLLATLVLACFGFGAVLWGWSLRDQLLTDQLHQQLQEKFSEWNITFESAEIDHRGRVIISNVLINPNGTGDPLCSVEALRITVNQDLLFNQRQLDVQSIEVNRPKLNLHRARNGKWNWEDLPLLTRQQGAPPVIKIRDAEVTLQWEHAQIASPVRVQIKAVDADIVPTGRHRFQFQGAGQEETLGASQFSGEIDTLHKNWSLSGTLNGLLVDQPFLQAATLLSSDAKRVVSDLKNSRLGTPQNPSGYSAPKMEPVSRPQAVSTRTAQLDRSLLSNALVEEKSGVVDTSDDQFSLQLTANLEFHVSKQADVPPEFTFFADLVNGQLVHPGLPIPLDKIQGRIAVDRLGMRLNQITIASGNTSARISGAWGWQAGNLPANVNEGFDIVLQNYRVTQQTRNYLPSNTRRVFDQISPTGILSTSFRIKRGTDRLLDFDLKKAVISNASIQHALFAYPVHQIEGTIDRQDNGIGPETWSMHFTGVASDQPVNFTGILIDPGPNYETEMKIVTKRLPIDDQFYRALRPKERAILEELNLQGTVDAHCTVLRKLSIGHKPMLLIEADVYDASAQVQSFPLAVSQLSGHVTCNESGWQFTRISAKHGETQLNGFGAVTPEADQWRLGMTVSADRIHFDQDLRFACQTASEEIAQVWENIRPRGEFGITVKIDWLTGEQMFVEIPLMELKKCEINPLAFPWRLSDLDATVTVSREGVVSFENLKAQHDLSHIETSGYFVSRNNFWQLKFDHLIIDDLFPDHEFMAALPDEFRQLMESMKIEDPASVSGSLELRGDHQGEMIEAEWNAEVVLTQTDIFLGVDINKISGSIGFSGILDRDGNVTLSDGQLALDSCWVMGYHVTDVKGPFVVEKDRIVVGSKKMFDTEASDESFETVSRNERVTGRIFGGELFLDLMARRTETMPYWMRCTLSRANLEQWASQSNYAQADIRGEMNGYIDLAGDIVSTRNTVGNGRLLISPAALYELPVLLQMFQVLRFTPTDGTAFRNAYAEFRVQDEKFIFDEIGLLGESMSLFGEGYIRFDRTIDMDFVYRPPRTRMKFVSQFFSQIGKVLPVLFTVDVTGTVDVPKVKVNGGVSDALQGFVKMLEMGPANWIPPAIAPPPRLQLPVDGN